MSRAVLRGGVSSSGGSGPHRVDALGLTGGPVRRAVRRWPAGRRGREVNPPVGSAPRPNRRRRPLLAGEVVGVLFLLFGYDRVAAFTGGRAEPAVAHGRNLLAAERSLHLAVEYRLDHALAGHPGVGWALSIYYDFAHGIVTFGVLSVLYLCRPAGYRPARRALVALNIAALVVFALFPVAPPRLLPGSGFADIVADSGTWGSWESSGSSVAQHANLYAALPSLHVGQASWVLLVVVATTRRRSLRGLAVAHLAGTILVVLSTGNHYVVDVAGGAGLTVLAWCAGHGWRVTFPRWMTSPQVRTQEPGSDLRGLVTRTDRELVPEMALDQRDRVPDGAALLRSGPSSRTGSLRRPRGVP